MMARDRNDSPYTWDWKSPDNHDLAYERERLQTIQVPPKPRGPVHTTAAYLVAYLVAYLGTFPKEKKDHLMQVAEAFAPYLGLLQHEETATDMCARVQPGDRSTLPVVPIMYGAIARKVNKHGMAETRQSFLLLP
jgi:hypothetical protein